MATAGCGKAPTLTTGTHTIQSSGTNRSYILNVPGNYDRTYRVFAWLFDKIVSNPEHKNRWLWLEVRLARSRAMEHAKPVRSARRQKLRSEIRGVRIGGKGRAREVQNGESDRDERTLAL